MRCPVFLKCLLLIGIVALLFYYFPNVFLSGKDLYKLGESTYQEGNHGDYNDWDKMGRAAFYFEKAISKGYHERLVYVYLTHCYYVLKNNTDEEKIYTLGIANYPNDAEFYFYRGECRKHRKDYQEALDDYDNVIKHNPQYKYIADAYYRRGAMHYALGDTIAANLDRSEVYKRTHTEWRNYDEYLDMQ